jgi:aryl-alcohol dehydrogenase-like predicted oxidoreductase
VKYKRLGKTDLVVSELGFGAFGIGGNRFGNSYGGTNDAMSIHAIRAALELRCNFFDTADVYGRGHSEIILGRALRDAGKLHDVVIATKGGCSFEREPMFQDFSREYLARAVDASLRRLGRDYIDLYQLHNPPLRDIEHGDVFETLEKIKARGKIRHVGVSIHTVDEGLACIKSGMVDSIQVVYNLFSLLQPELSAEALLSYVHQAQIGLIAREPLANGFLTGKHRVDTRYEDGDIRAEFSTEDRRLRVMLCQSQLHPRSPGVSAAQIALRFVLDEAAISTTIVGIKTAGQAVENFRAVDLPPFTDLYALPPQNGVGC